MDPLLNVAAVARLLDSSESFVRVHAAELGGIRLGGPRSPLRFDERSVRAYIEAQRVERSPKQPEAARRPGPRRAGGVRLLPLPKETR